MSFFSSSGPSYAFDEFIKCLPAIALTKTLVDQHVGAKLIQDLPPEGQECRNTPVPEYVHVGVGFVTWCLVFHWFVIYNILLGNPTTTRTPNYSRIYRHTIHNSHGDAWRQVKHQAIV